jgi:succinate dehydrogenase / fumarate reductase, cytochrome b subunit
LDHGVGQSLVPEDEVTTLKVGDSTIYKGRSGQWSFIAHRVTGFLVFFFLLMHIVDVSLTNHQDLYDQVHALYHNVFMRLFECGLLFALWFHALNGLRIIAVDFFPGAVRKERQLTGFVVFLTVAVCIPMSYVILKPWIDGHF